MNAGCILDNKFLDSNIVSSLNNVTIIKYGADRGMQDLIMEVSLGNRKNGNHGKYAILIGIVERAAETYSKLENTFYSQKRTMKATLEQLVNDELSMVRLSFYDNDDSTLKNAKCVIVHFCGIPRKELEKKKITCTIDNNIITAATATAIEWTSRAVDRIQVDDIYITRDMLSTGGVFDANGAVSLTDNNKLNLQI